MKSELFSNNMGFRPKGSVLKWWLLLPQMSTTIEDKYIPSLYGTLKSLTIPAIMVIATMLLDAILIFQLNESGVNILVLIIVSVLDFLIPFLCLFALSGNLYPAKIEANLFVIQTKLDVVNLIPSELNNNGDRYKEELRSQFKSYKSKKLLVNLIMIIAAVGILAFAWWKLSVLIRVFRRAYFYFL